METVARPRVPEDIALRRRHKSKWGLQVMPEFDIPGNSYAQTGHPPLSRDDRDNAMHVVKASEDNMAATSSCEAKSAEGVEDESASVYEATWPLNTPGVVAASGEAKSADNVEDELVNVYEPAWPLDMPGKGAVAVTTQAEMHNLWHPNQFTEAKPGYVTCTLCGVTMSAGQEGTRGRGRRHSVKALQAGIKPMAQCRGIKWYCCVRAAAGSLPLVARVPHGD
jgi:hypothetical protein